MLLGVLAGVSASLVIVVFRLLIEMPLLFVFDGAVDNYESLSLPARFLLPFLGALLLGCILHFIDPKHRSVSITHVLERLRHHQGKLPKENFLLQFFGGIVSLLSGQSVGREGPAVHLGAAVASQLGQRFALPNNSQRSLIACGCAAAISASFNTPMAGVIFAMEVILMEYSIIGFIPVIIASVFGTTMSQLVFGTEALFGLPNVELNILWEIPFMAFSGFLIALVAAGFIRLHLAFFAQRQMPIMLRFGLIGLVTGLVSLYLPQIMGTGFDTLNSAMLGQLSVQLLLLIVFAKLVVTAMASGMGMLGGIIGPSLVMGGCLGAVLGIWGNAMAPQASDPDFYVILGMVSMMGAILNAPLSALIAIVELSHNPSIVFPSMIMVVVSCVTVKQLFRFDGIFSEQLKSLGYSIEGKPAQQFLSRVGVLSIMNRSFISCASNIDFTVAEQLLSQDKVWLLLDSATQFESGSDNEPGSTRVLMSTADLAKHIADLDDGDRSSKIDLLEIAAHRLQLITIDSRADLLEANQLIGDKGVDGVVVEQATGLLAPRLIGVITSESIRHYHGI